MNASAAARPGEDDGLGDKRYRREDNWAVLHERQRWQEEAEERKQREEVEDERRHMRQCKIKTLEDMLDTHETRLVRMELWQVELDKLEEQGGPLQTEDNIYRGTKLQRRKIAEDAAEDHRGRVQQQNDFVFRISWDLRGLKRDAVDDVIDEVVQESTAYHSMHTIVEATEYQ